ncbi:polysaccharide biosynthesis tyrosine autokinase [Georgenia sp. EYE_87]|uniref:polysaccharide biosynthesis tyrosine autokinase n=1 Tax=Georgenia sp. EYE_87 TaxID=2853448 RepID=UPI002005D854|nr:polysaccharide biosynthesis tyrosine autokinase [Georgenia sp. EYE_87]MCK6210902.1 polysaccharide biosynthesis tyrosine autokinase [Georgenia sp. EYE_87]
MELNGILRVLRKRWTSVLVTLAVAVLLAVVVTALMPARYTATAKMFFSARAGQSITELNESSTFAASQMSSLADIATSPLVLEPVIEDLELDTTPPELAESLSITVPEGTAILQIAATAPTAEGAADLVNAVAGELSDAADGLFPAAEDGAEAVRATIHTPGAVPTEPSVPNAPVNLVLGVVLGLLVGVGVAALREARDTRVRGERDLADVTDATVLARLGRADEGDSPVFMQTDPNGQRAEAVRALRTNLHFLTATGSTRTIVVTSATAGEGKTTTAVNLAVALADTGSSVLLVDADMRRPAVARTLGLEGRAGLSTVLIGQANLEDLAQRWGDRPLDVLPAGQVPPNPSELLSSLPMADLLAEAAGRYDVVIVDSPPVLAVTDPTVLSTLAGGTLMVVATGRRRKTELREALDRLDHVGARVLGLVLNRADVGKEDTRRYEEYVEDGSAARGRMGAGWGAIDPALAGSDATPVLGDAGSVRRDARPASGAPAAGTGGPAGSAAVASPAAPSATPEGEAPPALADTADTPGDPGDQWWADADAEFMSAEELAAPGDRAPDDDAGRGRSNGLPPRSDDQSRRPAPWGA